MARTTCLADIDTRKVETFRLALKTARAPATVVLARVEVVELRAIAPALLICDIDFLEVDSLEVLRQLRFVLPECIIVVYTETSRRAWARECHSAGANAVLSKNSTGAELAAGLRAAMRSGCFTDPRVAVA
jgi:DNA-binding NarL/FixJ family response regulator